MTPAEMKLFMKSDQHIAKANTLLHRADVLRHTRNLHYNDPRIDSHVINETIEELTDRAHKAVNKCIDHHVKLFEMAKAGGAS